MDLQQASAQPQLTLNSDQGKRPKSRVIMIIMLLVLLLAALAGAGYLYWLWQGGQNQISQLQSDKTSLQNQLSDAKKLTVVDDLPVIVFSPGGQFTQTERTEITNKMLNPYKAWHKDQGDSVVSIHVQQGPASASQYAVDAIYKNGVYEGFLYGTIDAATQPWWHPTCMDACTFTDAFKAAYPSVVTP